MLTAPAPNRLVRAAIVAALVACPATGSLPSAQTQGGAPRAAAPAAEDGVPVLPERRPMAPLLPAPPALPAGADRVVPLTLRVTVRKPGPDGRARDVKQTVIRTVDRVHVAAEGGGEWLFERNPVDPRRVSGHFIIHRARTIVFYTDTDLHHMLGIPGWAHVLTLGCDLRERVTGAGVRIVSGLPFARVASTPPAWWNAEHLLPAECASGDGPRTARVIVNGISRTVDGGLLAPPSARLAGYNAVDLADWLEDQP
jgi:hypothetical protein